MNILNQGSDPGYQRLDLRDVEIDDMGDAVALVYDFKAKYSGIDTIVISRSQREKWVKSNPVAYVKAHKLEKQFNKPLGDLDFMLIISGCNVEVE